MEGRKQQVISSSATHISPGVKFRIIIGGGGDILIHTYIHTQLLLLLVLETKQMVFTITINNTYQEEIIS